MQIKIDLTGQIFNGWEVLGFAGKDRLNKSMWNCICLSCKENRVIDGYNLKSGRSKSCRRCSSAVVNSGKIKHGETDGPVYRRWRAMKDRCTNRKSKSWADYGGRGITVWPGWLSDYEAFRDHIGPMPTPRHTIDRIKNNIGYEPGNVRWATPSEQMANTRRSVSNQPDDNSKWPWLTKPA